ncbi:MAG: hypothetical protein D6770_10155 [Anaerolineae bacterium]|nr:MAG: hypothetical protein D6770_10155 [Anaerolineae bacterium]
MPYTLILHVSGEDPILGEVEELPKPGDTLIWIQNPRRRDGKDLHYLQDNVVQVIWPIEKINFIEVVPGEGEEEIFGFVRE